MGSECCCSAAAAAAAAGAAAQHAAARCCMAWHTHAHFRRRHHTCVHACNIRTGHLMPAQADGAQGPAGRLCGGCDRGGGARLHHRLPLPQHKKRWPRWLVQLAQKPARRPARRPPASSSRRGPQRQHRWRGGGSSRCCQPPASSTCSLRRRWRQPPERRARSRAGRMASGCLVSASGTCGKGGGRWQAAPGSTTVPCGTSRPAVWPSATAAPAGSC